MKRSFIIGISLIGALALASCWSAPASYFSGTVTPGSGSDNTKNVAGQEISRSLGTPIVSGSSTQELPPASGGPSGTLPAGNTSGTPTVGNNGTPAAGATTSATAAGTQSGNIAVPVTGSSTADMLKASDLMGYTVQDNAGKVIGMVQDLVLNPNSSSTSSGSSGNTSSGTASATGTPTASSSSSSNTTQTDGQVVFVIVNTSKKGSSPSSTPGSASPTPASTSSPASANGTLVPVPWSTIQLNLAQNILIVNKSSSEFTKAPNFPSGNWPNLFSGDWSSRLNTFWGTATSSNGSATMLKASDLMSYNVQDNAGKTLGTVQDLALDVRNAATPVNPNNSQADGLVAYVIVNASNLTNPSSPASAEGTAVATPTPASTSSSSSGGSSSSASGVLLPVPWSAIQLQSNQKIVVVNKPIDTLNTAPNFAGSAVWPDLFGTIWAAQLNAFWGNGTGFIGSGSSQGVMSPTATP